MRACRVACIQMRSGVEIAANIEAACQLINQAADAGAQFIATPEMTNLIDIRPGMGRKKARLEKDAPTLKAFSALAVERNIWLLAGSLAIALEEDDRLANRSFLIAPNGRVVARYDKLHMFDVNVGDGQSYRESKGYRAGQNAVLAKTPIANIGLTICYDVRFPALYRALGQAGAEIITCPAAFTQVTGRAHWHTLLRARAIETGAFVMAPAQAGKHEDGRETYGHALIISPWGDIISERREQSPGILLADIDLDEVVEARRRLPSLQHDQAFKLITHHGI